MIIDLWFILKLWPVFFFYVLKGMQCLSWPFAECESFHVKKQGKKFSPIEMGVSNMWLVELVITFSHKETVLMVQKVIVKGLQVPLKSEIWHALNYMHNANSLRSLAVVRE